jgi:hypothetical protein
MPQYPEWVRRSRETTDYEADKLLEYWVRVCDDELAPIPFAPCFLSHATDWTAGEADAGGWLLVGGVPGLEQCRLAWTFPGRGHEPCYPLWTQGFLRPARSTRPDSERLDNVGFCAPTLVEQVSRYQCCFGRPSTGRIEDVRPELHSWHDGGLAPARLPQAPPPAAFAEPVPGSATVDSGDEDEDWGDE